MPLERFLILALGWALIVVGIPIMMAPPPFAFGILIVAAGLVIVCSKSRFGRRILQRLRHRYPGFSHWLERRRERAPGPLRKVLSRTMPDAIKRLTRIRRVQRRRRAARTAKRTSQNAAHSSQPEGAPAEGESTAD